MQLQLRSGTLSATTHFSKSAFAVKVRDLNRKTNFQAKCNAKTTNNEQNSHFGDDDVDDDGDDVDDDGYGYDGEGHDDEHDDDDDESLNEPRTEPVWSGLVLPVRQSFKESVRQSIILSVRRTMSL